MISRIFRSSRLPSNALGRQEAGADELLGDRRAAARMAGEGVERGRDEAGEVEARVRPEVLVLDRGRRVEELGRDLVEGDELALELAELASIDLARAVGDRRLLVEGQVAQGVLRIGQALAVVVVGRGDRDEHPARPTRKARKRRIGIAMRTSGDGGAARPSAVGRCADGAAAARGWSACRAAR